MGTTCEGKKTGNQKKLLIERSQEGLENIQKISYPMILPNFLVSKTWKRTVKQFRRQEWKKFRFNFILRFYSLIWFYFIHPLSINIILLKFTDFSFLVKLANFFV